MTALFDLFGEIVKKRDIRKGGGKHLEICHYVTFRIIP